MSGTYDEIDATSEFEPQDYPTISSVACSAGMIFPSICALQADLSGVGVGKNKKNAQQGFMFRAWDDVQQALAPLLAKHKVFVVPRVTRWKSETLESKSGGTIHRVILNGEMQFVSGIDGSMFCYPAVGEAMDSGDKATSKALTMMVKYALTHGLCIPLEGVSDADQESHETKPPTSASPTPTAHKNQQARTPDELGSIADAVGGMISDKLFKDAKRYLDNQSLNPQEKAAVWAALNDEEKAAIKSVS